MPEKPMPRKTKSGSTIHPAARYDFGPILKRARKELELTQKTLGAAVGIDDSTVSKIESRPDLLTQPLATQIIAYLRQSGASLGLLKKLEEAGEQFFSEGLKGGIDPDRYRLDRRLDRLGDAERKTALAIFHAALDFKADSDWEARPLMRGRKWNAASEQLRSATARKDQLEQLLYAPYYANFGDTSYNQGQFEESIGHKWRLQAFLGDPVAEANNHVAIGGAFRRLARWDDAVREYDAAKAALPKDVQFVSDCDRKIIGTLLPQGRTVEARSRIASAYDELEEDDVAGLFKLQRHDAWRHSLDGEWTVAIKKYEDAELTLTRVRDSMSADDMTLERIKGARYLADVYAQWPEGSSRARKLYKRGLDDLRQIEKAANNPVRLLLGKLLLGEAHTAIDAGELNYAKKRLDEADDVFVVTEDPLGKYSVYLERGRLHHAFQNWDEAATYVRLAIQGFGAFDSLYQLGTAMACLCQIYFESANGKDLEPLNALLQIYGSVQSGRLGSLGPSRALFANHLSEIQSVAGRAHIQLDRIDPGYQLLIRSVGTGLSYNTEIFRTRFAEFVHQIQLDTRLHQTERAELMCSKYLNFVDTLVLTDRVAESEIARSRMTIQEVMKDIVVAKGRSK